MLDPLSPMIRSLTTDERRAVETAVMAIAVNLFSRPDDPVSPWIAARIADARNVLVADLEAYKRRRSNEYTGARVIEAERHREAAAKLKRPRRTAPRTQAPA